MFEKMSEGIRRLAPQYKAPQVLLLGAPYAAKHLGDQPLVWPPLGSLETYAVPVATLVIGLCILVPNMIRTKERANTWLKWSLVATFVMFILYVFLVGRYVITVETPVNGTQVRSVGFHVDPRIRALYPDKNDAELLRIGGLEDWQIETVWTPGSVLALRLTLLMSFALAFGIANIAIGSAARANKRKT
jgi:hypothetical protein